MKSGSRKRYNIYKKTTTKIKPSYVLQLLEAPQPLPMPATPKRPTQLIIVN